MRCPKCGTKMTIVKSDEYNKNNLDLWAITRTYKCHNCKFTVDTTEVTSEYLHKRTEEDSQSYHDLIEDYNHLVQDSENMRQRLEIAINMIDSLLKN